MFCPNCGTELPAGANYCGSCGSRAAFVSGSGKSIPVSNRHSFNAARSVASSINQVAGATTVVAAQALGGAVRGKVTAVALTAAIVAAGIILYNMFFVTKPLDVVYKFFNALNEKDINTAMTCVDPKYEKMYNATSNILESFIGVSIRDVADLFPALLEFAKYESGDTSDIRFEIKRVVSEDIAGDRATVVIDVEVQDETGQTVDGGLGTVYLQKFNEGWRIVDLE